MSLLAFSAPVPSVDGWFHALLTELKALIYALLCLVVSRIHAKEAGPSLGSTERFDRAGRINIVPDFIFAAYEPAHGTGQAVCGAGPASKGWLFSCAMTDLHRPHWPKGRGVTRNCICPFPFTKVEQFHWFPLRDGSCGTTLLGMMFQVPGSLYVQFIYFSPVVMQPGISLKLVAFDSKDVEQAEVHQANMKNLHCCVWIHLKMHRKVCFSLYIGHMLMFPSLFRASLLLTAL